MKSFLTSVLVLFSVQSSFCQTSPGKLAEYLNQEAPGSTPKVFAPGLVSLKDDYEFGSVFSGNGNEFYYAVNVGPIAEIRVMKKSGKEWSRPVTILTSDKYSHNDPFLSPDDNKLFFISDRPMNGTGEKKDYDIWYVQRKGDGWSSPINAGPSINSDKNEYYVSFAKNGTMYFSSNGRVDPASNNYDVFHARATASGFETAVRLNESINTPAYEADVFVAPDESYVIFCADRPEGNGNGDMYISFKKKDGSWTRSANMGKIINTDSNELCPYVSRDGKYLFYTSKKDIYWIDASIINSFRQ